MKKLMIAAAIVCAAVATQASCINWKLGTGQSIYNESNTKLAAGGTLYLFDAAVVKQSTLVNALFTDGSIDLASYTSIHNKKMTSAGAMPAGSGTYTGLYGTTGSSYQLYFAIVNSDGDLFISATSAYTATDGADSTNVSFSPSSASKKAALNAADGYSASAWYTVPEPTSGLLLLLGVAGLALRRRRA